MSERTISFDEIGRIVVQGPKLEDNYAVECGTVLIPTDLLETAQHFLWEEDHIHNADAVKERGLVAVRR